MKPRMQNNSLDKLKEKYFNDLGEPLYSQWDTAIERLIALKLSLHSFRQIHLLDTSPFQNVENLKSEIALQEKIITEIENIRDYITQGITGITEDRISKRLYDIFTMVESNVRQTNEHFTAINLRNASKTSPTLAKQGMIDSRPVNKKPGKTFSEPTTAKDSDAEFKIKRHSK